MPTAGLTPFAEFFGKRFVLPALLDSIKGLEPLMHQIQGVVDELGGLFGSHGNTCQKGIGEGIQTESCAGSCSAEHPDPALWLDPHRSSQSCRGCQSSRSSMAAQILSMQDRTGGSGRFQRRRVVAIVACRSLERAEPVAHQASRQACQV